MAPARRFLRSFFQLAFAGSASFTLLHCGGVDGTTVAPDPSASSSDSDSGDAGRRGRDSGSASVGDAGASTDAGSRAGDSGASRDSSDSHDASSDPAALMYAIDAAHIYSFDSDTGTIHRVASFTPSCDSLNDIAVDGDGNLYGAVNWTASDGDGGSSNYYTPVRVTVDTATSTATCTPIDAAIQSDQASLGFRAAGDMLGVSFVNTPYVSKVDPETAATQQSLFLLDSTNEYGDDVACSTSGTCWAAVGFGLAAPNIISFSDSLTGAATPAWTAAVSCWGLGYAKHALFCFESNGGILRLDLDSSPQTSTQMTLHMDDASALPSYWSGAASRPN